MLRILSYFSVLITTISFLHGGDAKKGEAIYKKVNCAQCHNADGMGKAKLTSKADIKKMVKMLKGPQIAGLKADYVVGEMNKIKAGKRKGQSAMMKAKVKKLTDAEVQDVAAYVQSLSKESYKSFYAQ